MLVKTAFILVGHSGPSLAGRQAQPKEAAFRLRHHSLQAIDLVQRHILAQRLPYSMHATKARGGAAMQPAVNTPAPAHLERWRNAVGPCRMRAGGLLNEICRTAF